MAELCRWAGAARRHPAHRHRLLPVGDHGLQGASETWNGRWTTSRSPGSPRRSAIGDRATADTYAARGQNRQNVFDPSTGYLRPRDDNGAFPAGPGFQTPPPGAFGQDGYDEGNAAQYDFSVQQDLAAAFRFRLVRTLTASRGTSSILPETCTGT